MKCMILAAGYATRMYPLTENFPKPLLEVGGKPILDWLVDDLKPVAEQCIVITNHKYAEHFISELLSHRQIYKDGMNIYRSFPDKLPDTFVQLNPGYCPPCPDSPAPYSSP